MKKSIILICSFLLLIAMNSPSVLAQEHKRGKDKKEKEEEKGKEKDTRRVGIKGGVNFSTLYAKDVDNTKMLTSFSLGLFAKLPIAKHIAIQPEIYYSPKGAELTYSGTVINGTVLFNFRYLEVPLMIVVNITDNFNFQIGPYASLLLSSKVTNVSDNNLFDFGKNVESRYNNSLDAGIALGGGIDVGAISLGMRYNHGLTTVVKENVSYGNRIPDANNGVISFYISISLN